MSLLLPVLVVLLQSTATDCDLSSQRPLFECDATLEFELELPMNTLMRKAKSRPVLDGELHYVNAGGETMSLDVEVTTRGHSRLEGCTFPPLSIIFHPKKAKGTVFAGQKKIKFVTQCKGHTRYLKFLRQEYGIYKAFNLLVDVSFRVRMLNVTFRDTEGKRRDEVRVAFLIESVKEVAERSGLQTVKQNRIASGQLDSRHAITYEVFQYMVANTDWSMLKGPGEEDCCHNGKVLAEPDSSTGWVVLPYDFDQAGLIGASYAQPDERLPIRSVRQRLFRGHCEYFDHLEDTIELFNRERAAIESALASGGISEKTRRKQADYIGNFYDIINDPKKRKRYVDDKCRGAR